MRNVALVLYFTPSRWCLILILTLQSWWPFMQKEVRVQVIVNALHFRSNI